jgi:hypothetical protein
MQSVPDEGAIPMLDKAVVRRSREMPAAESATGDAGLDGRPGHDANGLYPPDPREPAGESELWTGERCQRNDG